jgi:heavy metal sensor kinase
MRTLTLGGLSVRIRLTLWYALSLGVAMTILTATMYLAMRNTLEANLRAELSLNTLALAERLDHELEEGDEPGYASESLIRKSPFHNLSIEIYGPQRVLLAASADLGEHRLLASLGPQEVPLLASGVATGSIEDSALDRSGVEVAAVGVLRRQDGQVYTFVAGAGRSPMVDALGTLRRLIFTLVPLLLLLAAAGGWYLAHRALAPVTSMAEQARRMGADRLSARLAVVNPDDELGRLAQTFNELLDRIESAFGRMRQFFADASHEIRTPVSVIRSGVDVALTPPVSAGECQETLVAIRDQTARLSRLVEDMFTLARADAGDPGVFSEEIVPVGELVAACVRSAEALGRAQNIVVGVTNRTKVEPYCRGDHARLEQMLMNLLLNAMKHTGRGGRVEVAVAVRAREQRPVVSISVSDSGPGIPAEYREAVFERFVRLDGSRARGTGGSGLGLPIARWIAESHGGSLTLNEAPGGGCAFTATLPLETVGDPQWDLDGPVPRVAGTRAERV